MKCDNKFCLWNGFDQCCHESEEGHEKAVPNALDCPSSLRVDFSDGLIMLADECKKLIDQRNLSELLAIRKFIQNQISDAMFCGSRKHDKCSTRDYGLNQYKDPCYHCCLGCKGAIEMSCAFVCTVVAEHYYPDMESEG